MTSIKNKFKNNFKHLESNISKERLNEFRIRGEFSDIKTLGRYKYNIELSAQLYSAFSVLEVALRNQIVNSWSEYFSFHYNAHFAHSLKNWPLDSRGMYYFIAVKGHNPYDAKFKYHLEKIEKEYDGLVRDFEKINKINIKRNEQERLIINGDLVARLTFGFWRNCFDKKYNDINRWGLKKIFPRLNLQGNPIEKIKKIHEDFKVLNDLRNRFSHQEKVFHLQDLNTKYNLIEFYLTSINPDLLYLIRQDKFNKLWRQRSNYL